MMVNFFFTFCAFFALFISNTSIVSINFGQNLDAQNAGNDISGIQTGKSLTKAL
jgi:preprotein translocase subunit SecY